MDAKAYPARRGVETNLDLALKPVFLSFWFETNGASNPTTFSPGIESVTRQTADTSSQVFYRVRLSKFTRQAAQTGSVAYKAEAGMAQVAAGDVLLPNVITGLLVGGVAAVANREIDVTVYNVPGAAFTNSIAAGRRVTLQLFEDGLGGRRR